MESLDALVGDSINSDNELTPNSSIVNNVPVVNRNQNSITNGSSAQPTFTNHEGKRSISNICNDIPNYETFYNRSSISSNEDGSKKRPSKQEVCNL